MVDTVIVAVPPVGDRIHKISSEAVPHITLLYLGDVSLSEDAILYVQHACEELSPFGLSVDHRGTLGADEADVLFFEDNAWDLKRVKEFRHYLLLNDEIKRAYDSADQFPEWTPHLTLGYPESPARDTDEDDYNRMRYIDFDRIQVWVDEYDGPEFRLKYEDHTMEVSMSDMSTAEIGEQAAAEIFHFGVKGMKWGVRKSDASGGGDGGAPKERGALKRGATKANVALNAGAKVIEEGEKKLIFLPQENRNKAASATQAQVLATAKSINNKPEFKGKDLKRDPELKAEYFSQVEAAAKKIYADELGIARTEAWADFLGTKVDTTSMRIQAASNRIRHANDGMETLLVLKWELDDLGQIADVTVPPAYLSHADDLVFGELAHYGTKGMKWGVRNDKGHEGEQASTKQIAKADKAYDKSFAGVKGWVKVNNAIADKINPRLDVLNAKPEYSNVDMTRPEHSALHKKYIDEYRNELQKSMDEVMTDFGSNASGTKKMYVGLHGEGLETTWTARMEDVKHASDEEPYIRITPSWDSNGKITGQEIKLMVPEAMSHGEDGEHLAHYGVKGMKWGVTKNADGTTSVDQTRVRKSLRSTDKAVTVTQRKAGTYVKAKGGNRQTASQDAVKTQAARQKAKRSTTDSLSTKELKDTIERMRLEQEFAKLDKKVSRKGQSFVARLFRDENVREAAKGVAKKAAASAA